MVQGSSTKSSKWVRHNQVSWSSLFNKTKTFFLSEGLTPNTNQILLIVKRGIDWPLQTSQTSTKISQNVAKGSQ